MLKKLGTIGEGEDKKYLYEADSVSIRVSQGAITRWGVVYPLSSPKEDIRKYEEYKENVFSHRGYIDNLFRKYSPIDESSFNVICNATPTIDDFIEAELTVGAFVAKHKSRHPNSKAKPPFAHIDKSILALLRNGLKELDKYEIERDYTSWLLVHSKLLRKHDEKGYVLGNLPEMIASTYGNSII